MTPKDNAPCFLKRIWHPDGSQAARNQILRPISAALLLCAFCHPKCGHMPPDVVGKLGKLKNLWKLAILPPKACFFTKSSQRPHAFHHYACHTGRIKDA